jgi:hypothetical protein
LDDGALFYTCAADGELEMRKELEHERRRRAGIRDSDNIEPRTPILDYG